MRWLCSIITIVMVGGCAVCMSGRAVRMRMRSGTITLHMHVSAEGRVRQTMGGLRRIAKCENR